MGKSFWALTYAQLRDNPNDYEFQKRFFNEALLVLNRVYEEYDKFQLKFSLEDQSADKAIWMLHLDALDTLRDCIVLLQQKKHRIVGKLFRDISEVLDLSTLFWWEKDKGSEHLKKWYKDEIISHSVFRKYLKNMKGESGTLFENYSKNLYGDLSRWTHHCYSTLNNSYSLAGDNGQMLVYDGHSEVLISDQTISVYTWKIKDLTLSLLMEVRQVRLVNWDELKIFLNGTIQGLKFR